MLLATEGARAIGGLISLLITVVVIAAIYYFVRYKRLPQLKLNIDVTNKKQMSDSEVVDYYIITYGTGKLEEYFLRIEQKINNSSSLSLNAQINTASTIHFMCYRTKTRYRQVNYRRIPYHIKVCVNKFSVSIPFMRERLKFLKQHDYYVTYDQYEREDQRKALTKELRQMIKTRDNYTCQLCGKYMGDEVGLHIDHIIPVSKGGKSTPNNLRVLCSKCNGRKGGK
jgi:hypothetical protein